MPKRPAFFLLFGAVAWATAACEDTVAPTEIETSPSFARHEAPTILEIAASAASDEDAPEFTILTQAVEAADLGAVLDGRRQLTVFAPTDAAFANLLEVLGVSAADLLADRALLTEVLLYHVAPGRRTSTDVLASQQIRTLNGGFVFPYAGNEGAFLEDGSPATEDAQLLAPNNIDIVASNGVVHVIDRVLVPGEGSLPGRRGRDVRAAFPDNSRDGGQGDTADGGEPTILELVQSLAESDEDPEFTVLLAAITATELGDALSGEGELTVFAPTDAAFARLLELLGTTAEELLADSELLTAVLTYHVVEGALLSDAVLAAEQIETLNGAVVTPLANDDGAFLVDGNDGTENAEIQVVDIEVANGVVHVIDEVLLPS
jgi:transforming growth factor-beta-induced protein